MHCILQVFVLLQESNIIFLSKKLCAEVIAINICNDTIIVFKKESSPGPKYMVDYHYTRFGRDGTPHYSMLGKNKDMGKMLLVKIIICTINYY